MFKVFSKKQKHIAYSGFLFAILASAFSAFPNVIPKSLMIESTTPNPITLVLIIYVVNSMLFFPYHKVRKKQDHKKSKIEKYSILLLIGLGIAEVSGTLSYTIGLQNTSATNASILVNSETIFDILLGLMIFRERLDKKEIIPFVLIVLGSILIPIYSDLSDNNWQISGFVTGDFLIMLAGFFYCIDTFIAKKLDDSVKIRHIVHIMSCTGAIVVLCMMVLLEIPFDITLEQISIMSLVGFLGIGITMVFFVMALRLIGAVRTVLIYSTTIVFSMIYSIIALSESISFLNIMSVGIVILGLVMLRNKIS